MQVTRRKEGNKVSRLMPSEERRVFAAHSFLYKVYKNHLYPDTRPEITALLIERMRKATPARKLEIVAEMNSAVKLLALSGLKSRYPDDPPEKLCRRQADNLGSELALKAYGP